MAVAATKIASGTSTSATTTCNFTAQAAGTWLVLHVSCDDYRTTSGSGRPESTSWTLRATGQDEIGFYVWTKVAAGSETSVQYTIGSGSPSAWEVIAVTGAADTLANTPTATHTHGGSTTTSGSVTPPAGAFVLACLSAYHSTTAITGASWSNSYTQVGFQGGITSGNRETVASAFLSPASGAATSTTASWTGTSQLCSYGTALVFTEGSGSGGTTYDVTGTAASTSSASGAATRVARVFDAAGTAASSSSAIGDASRVPKVFDAAGAAASTSAASGDATRVLFVLSAAGTAASTSSASGDATRVLRTFDAAGTAASTSTAEGDTTLIRAEVPDDAAAGTAASSSSASGDVTAIRSAAGVAASSSAATGAVTAVLTAGGTSASTSAGQGTTTGGAADFYLFRPPTYQVRNAAFDKDRLFGRMSHAVGYAVILRTDGSYEMTKFVDPDRTDVQKVYTGGRVNEVTAEEGEALTEAGYGEYLTPVFN